MTVAIAAAPQTRSGRQRGTRPATKPQPKNTPLPEPTAEPTPEASPADDLQEGETLKTDTNLVIVPVIATTVEGNYISDLRQDEFTISEDGEKQQVAFFATVSAPFHVVLLLDSSASTQEKLRSIQRAAIAFIEQLQNADRVKVISFDNEVKELSEFTNDRTQLRNAVNKTVSGRGTKLYDAFDLALSSIREISGRRAIVLFSDGVDSYSDSATFDGTLHGLDEEGVIVYPIRYETRAETERIAREATEESSSLPTIGVIRRTPAGTTGTTFPSDDPNSVPTTERPRTGPMGLPTAAEILRRRRESDPNRLPEPDILPPTDPRDGSGDPRGSRTDPRTGRDTSQRSGRNGQRDDSVSMMIEQLYLKADSYLLELTNKSGGRLLRADTLDSLPAAFARIAAELRTQYAVGYYPTNKMRDGQYRKIKVSTSRKNVAVRARPGYRAPSGG